VVEGGGFEFEKLRKPTWLHFCEVRFEQVTKTLCLLLARSAAQWFSVVSALTSTLCSSVLSRKISLWISLKHGEPLAERPANGAACGERKSQRSWFSGQAAATFQMSSDWS
jgi:hypothetical protein